MQSRTVVEVKEEKKESREVKKGVTDRKVTTAGDCVCQRVLTQSLCYSVYETLAFIFNILLSLQWDGKETVVLSVTHIHLHTWNTQTQTHIEVL